jgi:hypothetical protein
MTQHHDRCAVLFKPQITQRTQIGTDFYLKNICDYLCSLCHLWWPSAALAFLHGNRDDFFGAIISFGMLIASRYISSGRRTIDEQRNRNGQGMPGGKLPVQVPRPRRHGEAERLLRHGPADAGVDVPGARGCCQVTRKRAPRSRTARSCSGAARDAFKPVSSVISPQNPFIARKENFIMYWRVLGYY